MRVIGLVLSTVTGGTGSSMRNWVGNTISKLTAVTGFGLKNLAGSGQANQSMILPTNPNHTFIQLMKAGFIFSTTTGKPSITNTMMDKILAMLPIKLL